DPQGVLDRLLLWAAAATFLAAAMATIALCGRLSLKWSIPRQAGTSGLDQHAGGMALLAVCLFVGLLAPVLAADHAAFPPRVRLGLHLFGFLPLAALMLALRLTKPRPRPGHRLARRPGWLVVTVLLFGVAVVGTLYDLGLAHS